MPNDNLKSGAGDRQYASTKRLLAPQDWKYSQEFAEARTAVIDEILSRAIKCRLQFHPNTPRIRD